jgi:predicted dehydrogenase
VKLAVIGAGVMGRNYVRALQSCPAVRLTAIVDTAGEKTRDAAAESGCAVFTDFHDLIGVTDAAVIAVPTAAHDAVAVPLLKAGIHCLVEKPFALSESACRAIMDAAEAGNAVLQVGHVERFNPVVAALLARGIAPAHIRSLTARRMGPASARVTDIDVVMDLMVHDLDVVLALKPIPVTAVTAHGNADHTEAVLTFMDGATAALTASRITPQRARDLAIVTDAGVLHLDYFAKSLRDEIGGESETFAGDALAAQLAHFAACIADRQQPRVSGQAALDVMRLAWRIQAAMGNAA